MTDHFKPSKEERVGVTNPEALHEEICKLQPGDQAKLLQFMAKPTAGNSDNLPQVEAGADGTLHFPGQFTLGTVGGTATDSTFKLDWGSGKFVTVLDAHNNRTIVGCDNQDASTEHPSDKQLKEAAQKILTPPSAAEKEQGSRTSSYFSGSDNGPESPVAGKLTPVPDPDSMERITDVKTNGESIHVDQVPGKKAVITAPKDLKIKETPDGGFDVEAGDRGFHVTKTGGLTTSATHPDLNFGDVSVSTQLVQPAPDSKPVEPPSIGRPMESPSLQPSFAEPKEIQSVPEELPKSDFARNISARYRDVGTALDEVQQMLRSSPERYVALEKSIRAKYNNGGDIGDILRHAGAQSGLDSQQLEEYGRIMAKVRPDTK